MPDTAGRMEAIKKRLITLIHSSSTWLDSNKVTGDQDVVKTYIRGRNFPFCTVRFAPSFQIDVIGRRTPNAGKYINHPFQIHLFHSACSETGHERYTYIREICNDIMDYLEQNRGAEQSNNIIDIYGLYARESKLVGVTNKVLRMIINGQMLVLREDQ